MLADKLFALGQVDVSYRSFCELQKVNCALLDSVDHELLYLRPGDSGYVIWALAKDTFILRVRYTITSRLNAMAECATRILDNTPESLHNDV